MARFTGKQKAFIDYYLQCGFNATEAARRAGYRGSYGVLAGIGHENLRKPKIAAEIRRRLRERTMMADEVLARLAEQARADPTDFYTLDEDGQPQIDLEKADALGKLHLIKKLYYDRNGRLRLELVDGQAALVQLGRHHGLFVDKTALTDPSGEEPLIPFDQLVRALKAADDPG